MKKKRTIPNVIANWYDKNQTDVNGNYSRHCETIYWRSLSADRQAIQKKCAVYWIPLRFSRLKAQARNDAKHH